jgi:hypothetical protein
MSQSSGAPPGVSGLPAPTTPSQPPKRPATQEKPGFRQNFSSWMQQLPRLSFPNAPNADFELIDRDDLFNNILKDADPAAKQRIAEDMDFLEHELLRLFRQRDYEASKQQNRYRLYQLSFMLLAALATLLGSLQGVSLNSAPNWVPLLALVETLIALFSTFIASISGREPPLPEWLANRRRAESLRREYFRYLMNTAPYDAVEGYERKLLLSTRAANINRGVFPDKQATGG